MFAMVTNRFFQLICILGYSAILFLVILLGFPYTSYVAYELKLRFLVAFLSGVVLTYGFIKLKFFDFSRKYKISLITILPMICLFLVGMIGLMQQSHRGLRVFFPF